MDKECRHKCRGLLRKCFNYLKHSLGPQLSLECLLMLDVGWCGAFLGLNGWHRSCPF